MPLYGTTAKTKKLRSEHRRDNGHFGALSYTMDNTFLFLISFAMGFFVYSFLLNHGSSH